MVLEVAGGLFALLSFLMANFVVGALLNATGVDITSVVNQVLGITGS